MPRYALQSPPFAGRTGAGVTVAIVDSGVHPAHPHVGTVADSTFLGDATDAVDRLGHGTAVAAAIRDIAPGARLIVAKVFDRVLSASGEDLARAIDWATDRGADVINLSLGTTSARHEELLRESVARASARGALVVAAREANGASFLPGIFPAVIGVVADARYEREEITIEAGRVCAAPYPRPIPGVPKERNLSGVSFAVANVTGFVARLLEPVPEAPTGGDPVRQAGFLTAS